MEQTYQYLLGIAFKHNYFKDGQFKSLQVSFDEVSMPLMQQLGIIAKPYAGGVHFLSLDPELLNDTSFNTPIRLFLDCNDPYYINYSELAGYSPSDTVLYFNNLDTHPNSDGTGFQLHPKDYVGQNEVTQLSFGKLAISNFSSAKAYHFKDVFGNDLSNYIRLSPNESDAFLVSNLPQGLIRVFANGQEEERVYYYPSPVWKKPIGVLELYPPQLYEQYHPNEKQTSALNFKTRSTIWKYFLMDSVYKNFEALRIVHSTEEQVFKSLENETVQGSPVLAFESQNPIPLSEYSEDIFTLVNDGTEAPVIKSLPKASANQLFIAKDTMYSHIYI